MCHHSQIPGASQGKVFLTNKITIFGLIIGNYTSKTMKFKRWQMSVHSIGLTPTQEFSCIIVWGLILNKAYEFKIPIFLHIFNNIDNWKSLILDHTNKINWSKWPPGRVWTIENETPTSNIQHSFGFYINIKKLRQHQP